MEDTLLIRMSFALAGRNYKELNELVHLGIFGGLLLGVVSSVILTAISFAPATFQVSTRILGRRTAPCPPFLIPNRVPHGVTQDPSSDRAPATFQLLVYPSFPADTRDFPGCGEPLLPNPDVQMANTRGPSFSLPGLCGAHS